MSTKPSTLTEADLHPDPFVQFSQWLEAAMNHDQIEEPNGMTIATINANGHPTARVVLLRGSDEHGLTFYTNYLSQKGRDLTANPHIAAVFWWAALQRQVRIEGTVEMVSAEESDVYFAERPIKSQMGATISQQSAVITGRQVLEDEMSALEGQDHIDRPDNWGGYRIKPTSFEFWQGRRSRLHDRLLYTAVADAWKIERLAP